MEMKTRSSRIVRFPGDEQIFLFDDEWNTHDGKVRELRYRLAPGGYVRAHVHPGTSQTFQVVSGYLIVKSGFKKMKLRAGERLETARGASHIHWNESMSEVEVIEGYNPPLDIEPFFTALPHVRRTKNIFKICVFFSDFSAVITSQTWLMRKCIDSVAYVGRRLGYGEWYAPAIQHLKDRRLSALY